MKKIIYIFSVLILALTSCSEEASYQPEVIEDGKYASINYTLEIPDYILVTKAGDPQLSNDGLWIMAFDINGDYLGRALATLTPETATGGKGTGTARVPMDTRIMHFVGNYDWTGWTEPTGQHENDVMRAMVTSRKAYWGRYQVTTNLNESISIKLLRNYAKLTVEDRTGENTGGTLSAFGLSGFAIGNYAGAGTVTTYAETAGNPFDQAADVTNTERLTLPTPRANRVTADFAECDMLEKYMFECENPENNQLYVIVQNTYSEGGQEMHRYYKLHLIKDKFSMIPWEIERNYHYKIILNSFDGDPFSNGSSTFEEAMGAAASNNLYAEIVKESPTISDNENNRLVVDKMIHLFAYSTNEEDYKLDTNTHYFPNGGAENNTNIEIRVVEGDDLFTVAPTIVDGRITGTVKPVASGVDSAFIRVSCGNLSRIITIYSSEKYSFKSTNSPILYTGKDDAVTLRFNIPETFPAGLYPVKCLIETKYLTPVGDNKNMLVVFVDNKYYFVYEAWSAGAQEVTFTTSMTDSNETIHIVNDYFETESIILKSTEKTIRAAGSFKVFPNTNITGTITISYDGLDGPGTTSISVSNGAVTTGTRDITIPSDISNLTLSYNGCTLDVSVSEFISTNDKVLINPNLSYVTLGAGQYRKVEGTTTNIQSGKIEIYSADGNEKYDEFTTSSSTNNNNHNNAVLSFPNTLDDNTSVLLRHTSGADVFELVTTIADLKATGNKDLVNTVNQYVTFGSASVRYGATRIERYQTVSVYSIDGEILYTTFSITSSNHPNYTGTIKIPVGVESVRLVHSRNTNNGDVYAQTFTLDQLRANANKDLVQTHKVHQIRRYFTYHTANGTGNGSNIPRGTDVIVSYLKADGGEQLATIRMTRSGEPSTSNNANYISLPVDLADSDKVRLSYYSTQNDTEYVSEEYTLTDLTTDRKYKILRSN
ncbi:hypothetical protein M2137_002137 [Parabacteroides sp. PFB2-10]|uniref:hypothetical protein n=1 Tax=Parabacteroides sp. PFB2-10 TaxID=1742405 RepID=UPI002475C351|nr:hypothetical protein [Parabacteroides sp. PFB2-10]MDH6313347.1 hypothetical protein [Parabacteroides sp. PFB2-10]MDL2244593.1 hypothetical protein [Parabacteroides sp. OttesenSCG-928-J18]